MVVAAIHLRAPIICTLILGYLLLKYLREKHLDIKTSKVFRNLLISATVNLSFDIVSELPNSGYWFSDFVNLILQTISLISLFLSCYFIYQYMFSYIELNKGKRQSKESNINSFLIFIGILWIFIFPLEVKNSKGVYYLDGPKVYGLYVIIAYFVFNAIVHLVKDKKFIPKKQYESIIIANSIFLITSFLQMVFPFLLISGIGLTLEVIVLYLSMENPERYINLETNVFNNSGLLCVLKEKTMINTKDKLYLYAFDYSNTEEHSKILKSYINSLQKVQHFCLYEVDNNILGIISKKNMLENVESSLTMKILEIDNLDNIKDNIDDFIESNLNKELYMDKMTSVFNRNRYEIDINNDLQLKKNWYIIADLNDLKLTNDTLGHEKGDELIKDFVYLLKSIFVGENIYRFGGDEFVILSSGDVPRKIELLRQETAKFNTNKGKNVSYAIGFQEYVPGTISWEKVTKKADSKMYENKKEIKEARKI